MTAAPGPPLLVLIPVYNEWEVVSLLLEQLDRVLRAHGLAAELLLVDDGSAVPHEGRLRVPRSAAIVRADVLELARNLGHQRAIAVALAWAAAHRPDRRVAVMDGDGEDDPADLPKLLAAQAAGPEVVFAARARRTERLWFRAGYQAFKALHWALTGTRVRVGNYSVLAPRAVARLAVTSETWNHYAAAVVTSRVPFGMVPTTRARRLGGRSSMSFTALVTHGFSALSVYSHVIGVRALIACGAAAGVVAAGAAGLAVAVPAGTGYALALVVAVAGQTALIAAGFVLLVLGGRQSTAVIPARDHPYFVRRVTPVPTL